VVATGVLRRIGEVVYERLYPGAGGGGCGRALQQGPEVRYQRASADDDPRRRVRQQCLRSEQDDDRSCETETEEDCSSSRHRRRSPDCVSGASLANVRNLRQRRRRLRTIFFSRPDGDR
jgi:hypothetical protein